MTDRELTELLAVRASLEETAIHAYAGDIGELQEVLDGMLWAAAAGDARELADHDLRFHRLIVAGSGNTTLQRLWDSLGFAPDPVDGDLVAIAESHWAIVDALRTRDAIRAARRNPDPHRIGRISVDDGPPAETAHLRMFSRSG